MMFKKLFFSILGFLTALMVITGFMSCHQNKSNSASSNAKITKKSNQTDDIPTIYLHGYGAGARSTNGMIAYAEQHEHAHKVLTATISKSGKVSLKGN